MRGKCLQQGVDEEQGIVCMFLHPLGLDIFHCGLARFNAKLGSRHIPLGGPFIANCYPTVANPTSCRSTRTETYTRNTRRMTNEEWKGWQKQRWACILDVKSAVRMELNSISDLSLLRWYKHRTCTVLHDPETCKYYCSHAKLKSY